MWTFDEEWDYLRLAPTKEVKGERIRWGGGSEFSLGAPILDFHIDSILDDDFIAESAKCLKSWVDIDNRNLTRVRTGIRKFVFPYEYVPNEPPQMSKTVHYLKKVREEATDDQYSEILPYLREALQVVIAEHHKQGDVEGAAKVVLAYLHVFRSLNVPYVNEIDDALSVENDPEYIVLEDGFPTGHVGIRQLERALSERIEKAQQKNGIDMGG